MAVSGKTSGFEIPYLEESDLPDMSAGDKAIAERVNAILKGIKGDASLATDGTLTLATSVQSGLGRHAYVPETSRESTEFGSFTTPLRVTLPSVKAHQLVEVLVYGWVH